MPTCPWACCHLFEMFLCRGKAFCICSESTISEIRTILWVLTPILGYQFWETNSWGRLGTIPDPDIPNPLQLRVPVLTGFLDRWPVRTIWAYYLLLFFHMLGIVHDL